VLLITLAAVVVGILLGAVGVGVTLYCFFKCRKRQSRKFPESISMQEDRQKMAAKLEKGAVSTNKADAEEGSYDHSYEEMVCT
jgi:Na+/melibiose symporter-like transporter